VELSPNDIGRSHRVGKPKTFASVTKVATPPRPRDILVQFASYRGRDKLFANKAGLRDSTHNGVYINEDLTRERSSILFEVRKLVKSKNVAGAWTADCNILVKTNDSSLIRVNTHRDLNSLRQRIESQHPTQGQELNRDRY